MFSFQHEVDTHKVFQQQPWSCRREHLVLKTWNPDITWQEVDFTTSAFWVQVHGLPTLWRTEDNLKKISAQIEKVLDVDLIGDSGGAWKRFLRVQVKIPIDKPLPPVFFLPRPNNTDSWIGLKYEKLANICYKCGIIGHEEGTCEGNPFLLCNPNGICSNAAGHWLRPGNNATPFDDTPSNNAPPSPRPSQIATPTSSNPSPLSSSISTDNALVPSSQLAKGPLIVHSHAPHSNGNTWQSFRCLGAPGKASDNTSKNNSNLAELDTPQGTPISPPLSLSQSLNHVGPPNNNPPQIFKKLIRLAPIQVSLKSHDQEASQPTQLLVDPKPNPNTAIA